VQNYIGTEHLLLDILREGHSGGGVAIRVLQNLGVDVVFFGTATEESFNLKKL